MTSLSEMIVHFEEKERLSPMEKDILSALRWFAKWETQIRASADGWKKAAELAKTDPGVANIQNEFPGSSLVTRHDDGTHEITYPPDGEPE
jgi:hypothetical protein